MFEPSYNRLQTAALVPKEKIGNWSRWRTAELAMPVFGLEREPAPEQVLADEAARQEAELDALRAEARAAGHAEAYAKGHAQGLAEGQAQGLEAGRSQGHTEGWEQGMAAARAEAQALQALMQSSTQAIESLSADVSAALTRLALDVARQVVGSELQARPESIVAVVQEILRADLAGHGAVQLRLHPDDAVLVGSHLADTLAEHKWRITPDADLARGDCRAQSAYGDIDATLKTRWQQVCATLGSDAPWQQN